MSDKYKYLGLVLTEHRDYDKSASIVAKSAGRAFGLLIAKFKAYRGLPYDCYTKRYDSLVQPIIDYGSAIWGTKDYSCINAVQHKACTFFMGVGKYTPKCSNPWRHGMGSPKPKTVVKCYQTLVPFNEHGFSLFEQKDIFVDYVKVRSRSKKLVS